MIQYRHTQNPQRNFHTCKAKKLLLLEESWQDRVNSLYDNINYVKVSICNKLAAGPQLVINHVTVATNGLEFCQFHMPFNSPK